MTRPRRHILAAFALLWAALGGALATQPATRPTTGPATRPTTQPTTRPAPAWTVLFATDPNARPEHGHAEPLSVIPDDVRAACHVDDVLWSTHRDHLDTAARAAKAGKRFVIDMEADRRGRPLRAALDNSIWDPQTFRNNLTLRRIVLYRVANAHPDLSVGLYDTLRIGVPDDGYTIGDLRRYVRAEAKALDRLKFRLVEGYVVESDPADEAAALEDWKQGLELMLFCARSQGRGETLVIVSPWVGRKGKGFTEWEYSEWLSREVLLHLRREGLTPMVFNPLDKGWDVVRDLAAK